ncbi:MAG: hypothetical protein CL811_00610 [Colwelliaceae bacterium]|nr:hypothetical protein [Colwelliaceae bacterium]
MSESLQFNKRIYISGYWSVGSNVKKSVSVYMFGIRRTFKLLANSTLYFFTNNEEVKVNIKELAQVWNINLTIIHRELSDLPASIYVNNVIDAAESMFDKCLDLDYRKSNEKGVLHYYRDLRKAGVDNYRELLLIWLSKIFLVREIVNSKSENFPVDSTLFCWVDCTAERFSFTRDNWEFTKQELPIEKISHYAGSLNYLGIRLPLSASFLAGGDKAWETVKSKFIEQLESISQYRYAHDEETLLTNIMFDNSDLFHTIGTNHHVRIMNYIDTRLAAIIKRLVYYRSRIKHL